MPESYNYYKQEVKNWILDNVSLDSKILDVGPGSGTYSKLLRPYGYKIDGVEIWQPYIEQFDLKNQYDNIYHKDILDFEVWSSYKFIIIGDCLEHFPTEKAQDFIKKIVAAKIVCLVAVPYNMEQGEYNGNIYETHHQSDLTEEIMRERYPDLIRIFGNNLYGYYINRPQLQEKAFVLYADESYYDLAEICCRSLKMFSKYPVYVYMLNSNKKVEGATTIRWDCDVKHLVKRNDYIQRDDKNIYRLLIERPKIILDALKYVDTVVYADTDSLASPYVDNIFDFYTSKENYPFFTAGVQDFLMVNGRGGAESMDTLYTTLEHATCVLFNIDQKNRQNYRQSGYFICGQNSKWFLEEWYWMCTHPKILEDNANFCPFNEETIMNVLRWKYNFHDGLPSIYINGLQKDLEFKGYEYHLQTWVKVPARKENLLFYHGEKNIKKLREFLKFLETQFFIKKK